MNRRPTIAFIKAGPFSHTNASVLEILSSGFPDYSIEVVDIFSDLGISRRDLRLVGHCIRDYGKDLALGRRSLSRAFLRTPYAFARMKDAIRQRLSGREFAFTFQTQSFFDASQTGIPHFVYTDHTHLENLRYPGFDERNLLSREWIECEREIYRNATMSFTMSSNISKSIVEDYDCDDERVAVVYCGANVRGGDPEALDNGRYRKRNILFVGIDWERKGGPVLLEAFDRVLASHPDANLTIVGCRPETDQPNVNSVGRVDLQSVNDYFAEASLFCLPTTLEPFGIVFLEAMAHKLPVIGTTIGAIPDFIKVGENGYTVEAGDVGSLADAICDLLDSPERCRAFGESGYLLYSGRYTWQKTGECIRTHIGSFLD